MDKFKIGDRVIGIWELRDIYHIGEVKFIDFNVVDIGHPKTWFPMSRLSKILINNSLNKKLYPNYKEYQGYLIPPKIAAKLKENNV